MTYIVDSNFFIQAHRLNYPLDVFKGFWDEVQRLANEGIIISLDKVKNEIYKNEDDLTEWCTSNLPDDFFKSSEDLIPEYIRLAQWVNSKATPYNDSAKTGFPDASTPV